MILILIDYIEFLSRIIYKIACLPDDDRRELFRNTADKMGLNDAIVLILDWRVLGCGKLEPWKKRFNTKQDAFNMEGCRYKLRVVRYHEQWEENGEKAERFMWLVTTLETAGYRVLCEMMNRRWNADNFIIYKNA